MELLDEFECLNPIEQLFADDNLIEVEQLEMDFPPRFSEVAARFGSAKCLAYIIEEGHELSPLINLYRIKRNEEPMLDISHPDELRAVLLSGHDEWLKAIHLPSIKVAFHTLNRLLSENQWDMIDYTSKIYSLYPISAWRHFFKRASGRTVELLKEQGRSYFLQSGQLIQSAHKRTNGKRRNKVGTKRVNRRKWID